MFSLVDLRTRVISCRLDDEEVSHYEVPAIFFTGDDELASITLAGVRSGQNVFPG